MDSHHIILLLVHYMVKYKHKKGKVCTAFSTTVKLKNICDYYGLPLDVVKIGFNQDRQQQCRQSDGSTLGQALPDKLTNRAVLILERRTEVAAHHAAEVAGKLFRQRLVHPIARHDVALDFGRQLTPVQKRAARRKAHEEKAQGNDDEQSGDRYRQPACDETQQVTGTVITDAMVAQRFCILSNQSVATSVTSSLWMSSFQNGSSQ